MALGEFTERRFSSNLCTVLELEKLKREKQIEFVLISLKIHSDWRKRKRFLEQLFYLWLDMVLSPKSHKLSHEKLACKHPSAHSH